MRIQEVVRFQTDFKTVLGTLLGRPQAHYLLIEQEVVDNFERPRQIEWHANQTRPGKKKSHKQWADSGAGGSGDARDSSGCGSLLWANDRHRVGLPGRHIHLTDAESHQ